MIHFVTANQQEAFMKVGTGYERLEIIREYKNIVSLQGYLPIPKIYNFIDTENQATIILQKMSGVPSHLMVSSLDRSQFLSIIKNILDKLSSIHKYLEKNFKIAALEELKDIRILIDNNKINKDNFIKNSGGLTPKGAYDKIQNDLKSHNFKTITHGDFCLPNIIMTQDGTWSLIDLGKCGLGDQCRDLSALEGSLKRNIDAEAFPELCKIMNIKVSSNFQQKIDLYRLMDFFWHNANLE